MNARARNFIRGVGSVVDIAPARGFETLVPHRVRGGMAENRIAASFAHTGQAIANACLSYEQPYGQATIKDKTTK